MDKSWKKFAEHEVTHSVAHYLTTLLKLDEDQGYARVSDIARELDLNKGSVSVQKKNLIEHGFVIEDANKHLRLTEYGQAKAREVLHNRKILIEFIEKVLGIDPVQAEEDACKIEHLVSWETCHRLLGLVQLLQSDDSAARAFLRKLEGHTVVCASHASPEECAICTDSCLAEFDGGDLSDPAGG